MVPGYNDTVRHEGEVFHIQTEDLGTTKATIVSHIFCGGQILHTARYDYRDRLESPTLEREVKKLLLRQHRDMYRFIIRGTAGQVAVYAALPGDDGPDEAPGRDATEPEPASPPAAFAQGFPDPEPADEFVLDLSPADSIAGPETPTAAADDWDLLLVDEPSLPGLAAIVPQTTEGPSPPSEASASGPEGAEAVTGSCSPVPSAPLLEKGGPEPIFEGSSFGPFEMLDVPGELEQSEVDSLVFPAVASPVPAVASPVPAVASPVPAVASPVPAVASPVPAVASPVPAVASPVPDAPSPVPSAPSQASSVPSQVLNVKSLVPAVPSLAPAPLLGKVRASGFLAEVISDRRFDLVVAIELGRLDAAGAMEPGRQP